METETIYRPRFGRWLCWGVWTVSTFALVHESLLSPASGLQVLPLVALISLLVWATFWNPAVQVSNGGVRLVNVWRTVDVPWPAILRIETKWALTLVTEYGEFPAWAAPAPGARSAIRLGQRSGGSTVPISAPGSTGAIRPGDLPGTNSGAAAVVIRQHWDDLREAGHLDNPRLEFARVPTQWHWRLIGGCVLLVAAGVIAAAL